MIKSCIILILFLNLITLDSVSQEKSGFKTLPKKWIGISINGLGYRGDLGQGFDKWSNGVGINIKFNKKRKFNGEFCTNYGSIVGQDPSIEDIQDPTIKTVSIITPAKYFKTNILTLNYQLHFHFIKTKQWMLSLSQGIGIVMFVVKDENGNDLFKRKSSRVKNEIYGSVAAIFPTTLQLNYIFKNDFGVNLNIGLLNPSTDYLDNVSIIGKRDGNDQIMKIGLVFLVPLK